ncbi:unnamed protein product [Prorocentrum cordatum]|uniref:Uncharacterized protein n=1 Tax=Prorocentrum cordatum TaxID=2364126 RepID=A0ABN9X3J7_9DINO|nr:unnamed protein product [Polarella glacialis]
MHVPRSSSSAPRAGQKLWIWPHRADVVQHSSVVAQSRLRSSRGTSFSLYRLRGKCSAASRPRTSGSRSDSEVGRATPTRASVQLEGPETIWWLVLCSRLLRTFLFDHHHVLILDCRFYADTRFGMRAEGRVLHQPSCFELRVLAMPWQ